MAETTNNIISGHEGAYNCSSSWVTQPWRPRCHGWADSRSLGCQGWGSCHWFLWGNTRYPNACMPESRYCKKASRTYCRKVEDTLALGATGTQWMLDY
jgi:hypothetical protein